MKSRQRTIKRLIRRYKISIHTLPKVRLRFSQRNGTPHIEFGKYGQDEMERKGLRYFEDGTYNPINKYWWFSGWMTELSDWERLFRYIREASYEDKIHKLDLILP